MHDFWETDTGRHLLTASQFLEAASVLDEAQRQNGRILFRPTLALAGQGLELMLKAAMHWNDDPPPTSGRKGHDIAAMWAANACEPVRGNVFKNAIEAASIARERGKYLGVPERDEIELIQEYVLALADLHGRQPYPLRYPYKSEPSDPNAPVTPWLVASLRMTADDFAKRPAEFKLSRFREG